jgi:four helix bundle suffix protein
MEIIAPHGGYRHLVGYQLACIVHDGTVAFTRLYVDHRSRTVDQMVQAARSGKQNIAEGSQASGTSRKMELKLTSVARASLEELLIDYTDYLRQNQLELWPKDHEKAQFIRNLRRKRDNIVSTWSGSHESHQSHPTYRTLEASLYAIYKPYIEEKGPENAANTMICLVRQTSFLLDKLLRSLEEKFKEEGGFTERLHQARTAQRTRSE